MWTKERWWKLSVECATPQIQVMCMLWKNIFTTDSAQRLIQDIMCCSRDLDIIKQKTNEVEQKLKNMVDVLGRI
ncbi:hypothetical protein AB205_0151450 [Aquarana catesbeiana]|uniref:Uncharacterized protein n=1 Tax=Aquarana catesbeiana TaxID=8400 RepID=A0A2G9R419_AQUCT|nr:hypothetical protein AB205_0151450 [Aquarana catesbeiana]